MLIGSSVRGIVTRSDLNKPPVRIYLFGLISLLEMHMQYWIIKTYGTESWELTLKEKRLTDAKKLQEDRHHRDDAIKLIDCLEFCDKAYLLIEKPDLLKKLNSNQRGKQCHFLDERKTLGMSLPIAKWT